MNMKKWITNKYNLNEDIYEWNNKYYIDFCLREDAQHFIKLCLKHNISFTYDAPYGVGIAKIQLKILIVNQFFFTIKMKMDIMMLLVLFKNLFVVVM